MHLALARKTFGSQKHDRMARVTTNQTRWNAWKCPRLVIWQWSWGNAVLHIPLRTERFSARGPLTGLTPLLPLQSAAQLRSVTAPTARDGMQLPKKSISFTLSNLSPAYCFLHQKKKKSRTKQTLSDTWLSVVFIFFFSWIISASVFVIWKKSTCVRCTLIRILARVCILYRRSKVGEISFRFEASRTRLPKSSMCACQPYTARLCLGVTGLAGPRSSIDQVLCRTCMDTSYKTPTPHPVLLRRDPANYT